MGGQIPYMVIISLGDCPEQYELLCAENYTIFDEFDIKNIEIPQYLVFGLVASFCGKRRH